MSVRHAFQSSCLLRRSEDEEVARADKAIYNGQPGEGDGAATLKESRSEEEQRNGLHHTKPLSHQRSNE